MLENENFINRLDKLIPSLVLSSPIQKERIFKTITIKEKKEIRKITSIQTTSENYILEALYKVSFLAPLFPNKTYFQTYNPNLNSIEKEIIDDNKYKTAGIFEAFMTKIDDEYLQAINNKKKTSFLRSDTFNEPKRFCKIVIIDNNEIKINEESLYINKDFQKRTNNRLLLQVNYDTVIINHKPTDVYNAFRYFAQEKYSSMNIAENVSTFPLKMEEEGFKLIFNNISNKQDDSEVYDAIKTLLQNIPEEKNKKKIKLWKKDDITEKKVNDIIKYTKNKSVEILSSEEIKIVKSFLKSNYFGNDFSIYYKKLSQPERIQKCEEIINNNSNKSSNTKVESAEPEAPALTSSFEITLDKNNELPITFSSKEKTLYFEVPAGYKSYAWYLNGKLEEEKSNKYTIVTDELAQSDPDPGILRMEIPDNKYSDGLYEILVVVEDSNGEYYSATATNEISTKSARAIKTAETKRFERIREIIEKYKLKNHSSFEETFESSENETREPLDQSTIINNIRSSIDNLIEVNLKNSNNPIIIYKLNDFSKSISSILNSLIDYRKKLLDFNVLEEIKKQKNLIQITSYIINDVCNDSSGEEKKLLKKDLSTILLSFFSNPKLTEYFKTVYILQTKGE